MPLTLALSRIDVNWMTIWPLPSEWHANCRAMAMSLPPAAAKMSKLVRTGLPLIKTLKSR